MSCKDRTPAREYTASVMPLYRERLLRRHGKLKQELPIAYTACVKEADSEPYLISFRFVEFFLDITNKYAIIESNFITLSRVAEGPAR